MKKSIANALAAGVIAASMVLCMTSCGSTKVDPALKVNVDDEPELAMKFKVSSIPMLVLFKDGRIVSTSVGYRPKDEILNELKLYINQR